MRPDLLPNSGHRLLRITTALISLDKLLELQMRAATLSGLEVLMASADGPRRSSVVARECCDHVVVPMRRGIAPLQDLRCLVQLTGILRRWRPSIVHSHTPKAGLLGMLAARLTGVPVRIHTWGGLRLETTSGYSRRLLLAMERLTAKSATTRLANSFHLQATLTELGIARDAKVLAAGSTNGVDTAVFHPPNSEERLEARTKLELSENMHVLLFLGRLVRDKGIVELVNAFQSAAPDHPATLLLVGEYEHELDPLPEATLRKIHEDDRIRRLNWTEDVPRVLHAADVLVHPTHREGLPNVVLQAAAAALPIIASDVPGNREILGPEAKLHPVNNETVLASLMRDAMQRPHRGGQDGESLALAKEISKKYSRRTLQNAHLDLYRRLLSEHAEAARS